MELKIKPYQPSGISARADFALLLRDCLVAYLFQLRQRVTQK
jgi:hypothetical protein